MAHCTNCGRELPDGGKFCPACGTRVAGVEVVTASTPSGHRAIPWWVGVAIGVFVLSLVGALVWGGGRSPSTSVIEPPDTFAPAEPGSGSPVVPSGTTTLEELSIGGVNRPGLLPTSPFYFLKGISRSVQYAFTFSPDEKADLKLRYANQDALAIRALCFAGQYAEAAQECATYQGNFFDSLAWTVKAKKQGGDIEALMLSLTDAHRGHCLVLADALTVNDALLTEAVIGAVAYTSAPLEQVIRWTSGDEAAAAFYAKLRNDFSAVGAHHWEDIEEQSGLSVEQSVALAQAMWESASTNGAPVVTSLETDAIEVKPGAACILSCSAWDPDGDDMHYEWLASAGQIAGDGPTATWTAPAEPGLYEITVLVSDDSGNQAHKAISIRVEAQETPYPGYLGDELLAAAASGDTPEVARLLELGADVNARGDIDQTALHEASYEGRTEVVNILLDHGADVDALDESGITPLRVAAERGHIEVVTILLDSGAYVNAMAGDGFEPLHIAAAHGHVETARALLDRGADLKAANASSSRATALHLAAQQGHTEVAGLLLDRGADVDAKALRNRTPLMAAAKEGHTGVARLLLERGADVNAREDVHDFSPLHFAAYYGHTEMARLLLEHEADVNASAQGVATPLVLASANSYPDVVALLEEHGGTV